MVEEDDVTGGVRVPSHRYDLRSKIAREVDIISSLPDVILQHILCFNPIELAIRTSLLSKRWRYVWCDTPSLSFNGGTLKLASLYKTQNRYTAPKMMNLQIRASENRDIPNLNSWIELAMSRNVENMSLEMVSHLVDKYDIPESFYVNTSLKQLNFEFYFADLIPRRSVSWTSLKKLSLRFCKLSDESVAKFLSGCPILESLTLYFCDELRVLDLSKLLRLRTLQVVRNFWGTDPLKIVAPQIHRLIVRNSQFPCTLVDVSSLTEAKVNICFESLERNLEDDSLQVKVLEKFQNVEKLTIGGDFLQMVSFAELRGEPFPMFKVKDLTIETSIFQFVIPAGIKRVLQNSPDLKKLTIHTRTCDTMPGNYIDRRLDSLDSDPDPDQCLQSEDRIFRNKSRWDVKTKHVASFMELMLKNTKRLEKMIVHLEDRYLKARGFKSLTRTLSRNSDVSIVFSTKPTRSDEWGIIGFKFD
ncbi:unnamed protein product [Arabidopsis arenosa]|uniref:F-box domain-containing protein n=1 Tax=Arabidopsis arenosa TaxID=38785 RepID=A0A8S2A0L5_ARAAE|nr:unnamed protein product [Arabidopsis arenosa]